MAGAFETFVHMQIVRRSGLFKRECFTRAEIVGGGESNELRLVRDIRAWTPARRRNSEGEYKIELRKHLESLKHKLNEEFGESKCDLLVGREHSMEVKKDPDLGEYDRLR